MPRAWDESVAASTSTAMPSGSRQPVTMVLGSDPSGSSVKTRFPLRSRTKRRLGAKGFIERSTKCFGADRSAGRAFTNAERDRRDTPQFGLREGAHARYIAQMEATRTTAAIQGYLDELAGLKGDSPAEPVVRSLLGRSAGRLHQLCATLLYNRYPRLTRAPLNLQSEEILSAVVERLMKSLREARPGNVRQFFSIANQHMRWELNDVARRSDNQVRPVELGDHDLASPESSASEIGPVARRMFRVIDELPAEEREVFELVRIQGMTPSEVAGLLNISERTVQRRLNRGVLVLSQKLGDLRPIGSPVEEA